MKPAIITAMTTLVALGTISLAASASAEIRLGASVSATGTGGLFGRPGGQNHRNACRPGQRSWRHQR